MPFAAVLDASVLYPLPLRDTLLRIAETELYDVYWREHILHEVVRNLIADGRATEEQARRLTDTMTAAFEGAAVPQGAVDRIEPGMTNEPKDPTSWPPRSRPARTPWSRSTSRTSQPAHADHWASTPCIPTRCCSTCTPWTQT
jgi:hypothetical protein